MELRLGVSELGGQNLPFPITLTIGSYNSLYYRTSRDKPMGIVILVMPLSGVVCLHLARILLRSTFV